MLSKGISSGARFIKLECPPEFIRFSKKIINLLYHIILNVYINVLKIIILLNNI